VRSSVVPDRGAPTRNAIRQDGGSLGAALVMLVMVEMLSGV
jgi:hypothetical protein